MYKIITDISILTALNEAASQKENNPEVKYCEENKHCNRDEWAIPIIESILRTYKLPFIDELLHGLVESLSEDWTWHIEYRPIRITIPNEIYAKMKLYSSKIVSSKDSADMTSIKATTENIIPTDDRYLFVDKENIVMYLEELTKEIEVMLNVFEVIKIETK